MTDASPRRAWLAAALLALAWTGCGGSGGGDVLDPGRFEGRTFVHDGFGLRVTFPEKWVVIPIESTAQVGQKGRQVLAQGDPSGGAYRAAGPSTSRSLFTVYRHPLGNAQGFNPSVVGGLENVLSQPQIDSAVDYLGMMQSFLARGGVPMTFEPIVPDAQFGNARFAVLGVTMKVDEMTTLGQVYLSRRMGDYMLTVIASFAEPDQWAEQEAILQSITLEQ